MSKYRENHYVPIWYQERFIPSRSKERKYYYLDKMPETRVSNGHRYKRSEILRWGPPKCFSEYDLYTTKFGGWLSTEIEQQFFGRLDEKARASLDYFASFAHPSADGELFQRLMLYMSIQKLRTPKGLRMLSELTRQTEKNRILHEIQRLQQLYCAVWTECVWCIADASDASVGLLVSDHPVTVYNQGCFPASRWCREYRDPDVWLSGTHTIFPLSIDKLLILTNLSWVRHPYGNPINKRPHHDPFRQTLFKFTRIQTGRKLTTDEVQEINLIIKQRALRYVAAAEKDWLYPERTVKKHWDQLGKSYLLMPDPRSVSFSGEVVIGFKGGRTEFFDPYGRKPSHQDYDSKVQHDKEWETFHAFQGEFARLFGPRRRGLSYDFGRLDGLVDSEDLHKYHLRLEQKHKKHRFQT